MLDDITYFDPKEPVGFLQGNLPHWRQEGVAYFVTFRLADSIPRDKLDLWEREREAWLMANPRPHTLAQSREYHERFIDRIQRWLDAGYGECHLSQPDLREVVVKALEHFRDSRYKLHRWVAMPNHIHAVVSPADGIELSDILHSWKSYTSNKLNRALGREGTLWQKEGFDHIVRKPASLERIFAYIDANPEGLAAGTYSLSHPRGMED